ncbi:MAG: trypsin-like peptidase domain-containing protein [Alphaproteobacteria bacterium]
MKKLLITLLFVSKISLAQDFVKVAEDVLPSVVSIVTIVDDKEVVGSGFLIDETGLIVTNNHVIKGAREIKVFLDNNQEFTGVLKGKDDILDIALVKINPYELLPHIYLADSKQVKIGQKVMAIGNPFGLGNSVSVGIVSAKSRDINSSPYDDYIQTDATINMGNSGGPLFDMNGKVIGMITAMFSETIKNSGVGFALPSNQIKWIVDELKKNGKITRGWIGLTITPLDNGIKISEIVEDSPANKAGLSVGDLILKINDKDINKPQDLSQTIAKTPIGEQINIQTQKGSFVVDVKNKPEKIQKKTSSIEKCYVLDMEVDVKTLEIVNIKNNSDAFIKGLKQGDVIKSLDNKEMLDCKDITDYLLEIKRMQKTAVMAKIVTKDDNTHFVELKI